MNILEVEGLCKTYPAFRLRDVSFAVAPGTIMGFIGRNGAGKSTTIKSMLNLVHPDSGRVTMFGQDFYANEPACKQQLGVVLGGVDFYPNKKLRTITNVTRTFYDRWDENKYRHYLQLFALDETKKVSQLSSGMRVKYMLALALSHDARLLILDEPTSGLDPAARAEVHRMLAELRSAGTTVFLTTHDMAEADSVCDRIAVLDEGRIAAEGEPQSLKLRYARNRVVVVTRTRGVVETAKDASAADGLRELFAAGEVLSIHSDEPNLEEVFLELTGREF